MDTVKLYLRSMKMQLKCQMQYPASFFLQTLAQFVMEAGELLAVILIVDRFESLNQWGAGDLYFFFGLMSVTFYLTECFGRGVTGAFPSMVRSGQVDTLLLRPRGVLTQVMCWAMDPRRFACIAVGTAALILGSRMAAVRWTVLKALALAEAIVLGGVMILGLFLIEGIFVIHSVKSVELVNGLTYGGRSACEYPIDVYPRPLRVLFTVAAPFALVLQVPAAYILGKPLYGWPGWTAFVCPLAGLVSFGTFYALFQRAMRFYRSTGS